MEKSYPFRESLASAMKYDKKRFKSKPFQTQTQTSKTSILLAFFSCLAWLYVAGRLWQDAQNRTFLTGFLSMNLKQRPKVLTVDDKLMILGCNNSMRKIVDAEMDLTLAKSQGYLRSQLQQSKSGKKLLAVIGVYTGFGSRLTRNIARSSWMPKGEVLRKFEERGIIIRFVIGRSANRGDSLDRNIDEENRHMKDFFILDGHEEAQEELPKKAKFFFSSALENWDAEFYVKVDDNISLDLDGLIGLLENHRSQNDAYMGCMKSGDVIDAVGKRWYEPDWWKFGDKKTYFRHAAGAAIVLSKNLVRYVNINSASLRTYSHEDVSVGAWMMGIQATYIDDNRFCCSSPRQDKVCSLA